MVWTEPVEKRHAVLYQALWFGAWLGITAVALWLQPSAHGHGTHTQLGLPACPSVMIFDRPCPGCGLTTAFAWMVRARVDLSFASHAMGPLIYLLFTASAWAALLGFVQSKKWRATDTWNWILVGVTAAFLVYGVARFFFVDYNSPFHMHFQ